jgi:nitrogen fixation/metabolism regulation signal transduction histidine kinase
VTALALGLLLAAGIARPIRALARRAEEIAAERREPFTPPPAHDEVQRLTAAFDTMLASLDESARRQASAERIAAWQEVARRIAHEVKNPLSPIKLAVENLLRTRQKAPAELDRALEEESATILEEVESLRRLVDEFSQFARLPAPQPAEVDPAPIVSHALALLAPRIDALGVKTDVDDQRTGTRTIRADAEQIGRVLKNVIANALDALEPVTNRRLSIALRDREDSRGGAGLEIEVADSGVGLSPALAQRMFEPYVTTRAERGGTGLGLAIAERIVSEHGGTIRARGEPGRGATITIRLPAVGPPL